ncbi:hypothetical protein ACS0TY_023603 [Phlomoides rotata]
MEMLFENLDISHEEEKYLIIDDGNSSNNSENADLCLVGHFVTEQSVNFNIPRSRITSAWKPKMGVIIKEIGNGRIMF